MSRVQATLLAVLMLAASAAMPAFAQDAGTMPGNFNNPNQPVIPPGNPDNLSPGADAPQPLTGELVPLPGPPPVGGAADLKLPDCAPPNCGTPQIMQ